MATRRYPLKLATLLVAVLLTLVPGALTVPAAHARDVSGNTYTSPNFGYTITWEPQWIVVLESTAGNDVVMLTDGLAVVILVGSEQYGANANLAATVQVTSLGLSEGTSEFVIEEQSGDADRYQMTVSMTVTENGQTIPMRMMVEARAIPSREATVLFMGMVQTELFDLARPDMGRLLETLTIPGAASGGDGRAAREAESELVKGEDAPVYMAGPWRVAIVAAAQGPDIPGVGLDEKDGKEWVVVVADITNWGSSDPAFPTENFFVQMAESETRHKVASGSTASVARELDLPEDLAEVEIAYGETGRVVMVFSVNAGRTEPSLIYRMQGFSLAEVLLSDVEARDLSEPAGPPDLQEATLDRVAIDGETVWVRYEGQSRLHRLSLAGIDASDDVQSAEAFLDEYVGETVYIEADPELDDTATGPVYLWIDNDRGDRQMLNQMMLEDGVAVYEPLPDDARFARWFQVTADRAG